MNPHPVDHTLLHLFPSVLALVAVVVLAGCSATADIELSPLFSDGVVIQQDAEVPVWGTARPGARIMVLFQGHEYHGRADDEGRWVVRMDPYPAGGPYELQILGADTPHTVRDVYVGDVWIASGQSNMEWTVGQSYDAEAVIAAADDPMIRQFKVPHLWSATPVDSVVGGPWRPATPEHVGAFSAAGYFFAQEIRAHHDVPIGLINNSWGGARLESYMSAEALGYEPDRVDAILSDERRRAESVLESIRERLGELPESDPGLVDGVAVWADPDLDTSDWDRVAVPATWESEGYPGVDGVAWYRTTFELTAGEAAADVTLGLGQIDDSDRTWVNGREVGGMDMAWNVAREYRVPAAVLNEGPNVVAVRVEDTGGGGGIGGSNGELFVRTSARRIALAGQWSFRLGEVRVTMDAAKNQVPVVLYNAMVHPFLDFPIKGVIWYQGESNAGGQDAFDYRDLFATMIRDWRARWGVGDFPFIWVQLANYMAPSDRPSDSDWAMLRESQSAALAVANTAEAVIIDIGEAGDIHPKNKQDVGYRLGLAGRALAYGDDIVYSGPRVRDHAVEGNRITLTFDHVGGGLTAVARPTDAPRAEGRATAGRLTGFAIAGADRRFVRAEARIDGDRVVVSSPRVPDPVAVRYAWADNPDRANLFNAEGLPASPFRTDTW